MERGTPRNESRPHAGKAANRRPTRLRSTASGWSASHQADHGPIRIEIGAPQRHYPKHGKERPRDDVELFAGQLVERQPLAEDSVRLQAAEAASYISRAYRLPAPACQGLNRSDTTASKLIFVAAR